MASLYDVGFNGGSVDAQPSISKVTKLTKKIDNLQPGVTYTILIRAKKNGQLSDYASYVYKVPETDKSGNNFTVSNQNTDIQLLGGGFAASKITDPLPINIGKIQVTDVLTAGTGVILNQYGLIGYKAGTKTFYIDAGTGDAYFGGTLSATSITSGGGALSSDLANYAQISALTAYATKAGLGTTNYTTIHGGNITTGTIISSGYIDGTDPFFSSSGTGINLDSGTFRAKQFGIDSSGNAKFAGTLTTGSTGNYIKISATDADRIQFYSTYASSSSPGIIYSEGSGGGQATNIYMQSPKHNSNNVDPVPYIHLAHYDHSYGSSVIQISGQQVALGIYSVASSVTIGDGDSSNTSTLYINGRIYPTRSPIVSATENTLTKGLRNALTISSDNYNSSVYSTANDGDILLVYTP